MTLIGLIVVLLVVGFALYLVSLAPIDPTIKRLIQAIVLFVAILWVLSVFGLLPSGAIRLK